MQVRRHFKHVDVLVNNADVLAHLPPQLTDDGHERMFQLNYLGHFLLSMKMLPLLSSPPPEGRSLARGVPASRIVHVVSDGHTHGVFNSDDLDCARHSCFDSAHLRGDFGAQEYANTQLQLVMFSMKLQRMIDSRCPHVAALHGPSPDGRPWVSPVLSVAAHPAATAAGLPWVRSFPLSFLPSFVRCVLAFFRSFEANLHAQARAGTHARTHASALTHASARPHVSTLRL